MSDLPSPVVPSGALACSCPARSLNKSENQKYNNDVSLCLLGWPEWKGPLDGSDIRSGHEPTVVLVNQTVQARVVCHCSIKACMQALRDNLNHDVGMSNVRRSREHEGGYHTSSASNNTPGQEASTTTHHIQ